MSSHDVDISILRKINNRDITYNAFLQFFFCIKYDTDFFITDKSCQKLSLHSTIFLSYFSQQDFYLI